MLQVELVLNLAVHYEVFVPNDTCMMRDVSFSSALFLCVFFSPIQTTHRDKSNYNEEQRSSSILYWFL